MTTRKYESATGFFFALPQLFIFALILPVASDFKIVKCLFLDSAVCFTRTTFHNL